MVLMYLSVEGRVLDTLPGSDRPSSTWVEGWLLVGDTVQGNPLRQRGVRALAKTVAMHATALVSLSVEVAAQCGRSEAWKDVHWMWCSGS